MTATIPPRFPISADQIALVVARFYARVRAHPVLGPVFGEHVHDWTTHEAKIARFWRNAILLERSYDGNPMGAHMNAGNVEGPHFAIWLGLFDEVLQAELPPELAQSWSAMAHRIGRGLRLGIEGVTNDGPPRLD